MTRAAMIAALALVLCPVMAEARGKTQGFCEDGNVAVTVPGTTGSGNQRFMRSYSSCTVTVYLTGTVTLATIFSDDAGTSKANPFTAASSSQWFFYADDGRYDVRFSAGGITTPFTMGDMYAFDTARPANVRVPCDPKFTAANAGLRIANAITDIPSAGGIVDARCFEGAQTIGTTVTINKPILLLLGAATFTGPSSGAVFSVQQAGVRIVGAGARITVIKPTTAAQSHGIHLTTTSNGHVAYSISDLSITDASAGAGRTAGAGIYADAAASPAQNSIGSIERVEVTQMFDCYYLNRPILTMVYYSHATLCKQDGFVAQGDGTSLRFIGTYSNSNVRHNYHQRGMTYVGYINSASDTAGSIGYNIVRQDGTTGNQAIAISMDAPGAENSTGKSIYILDAWGVTISSPRVLNSTGQAIHLDGAREVFISGGRVQTAAAGTTCINVSSSATPQFPDSVVLAGVSTVACTTAVTDTGVVNDLGSQDSPFMKWKRSIVTSVQLGAGVSSVIADTANFNIPLDIRRNTFGFQWNMTANATQPVANMPWYRVYGTGNAGFALNSGAATAPIGLCADNACNVDLAPGGGGATFGGTSNAAVKAHYTGTASLDFAAWAGTDCQTLTVAVGSAADGDTVVLGIPNALASTAGVTWYGWVSSAGVVSVRGCKVTAAGSADPGGATVRADVWRH